MPLSAHLASLSNQGLISDNFSGFCEAAWPCLAVGGAQNEVSRKQTGEGGGPQEVEMMGIFSTFQSNEKASKVVSDESCCCICFLSLWKMKFWMD